LFQKKNKCKKFGNNKQQRKIETLSVVIDTAFTLFFDSEESKLFLLATNA